MRIRIEWGKAAKPEDEVLFSHLTGSKRVHLQGPGVTFDGWYRLEEREDSADGDVILDKAQAAVNRLYADGTRSFEATRAALLSLQHDIDAKLKATENAIRSENESYLNRP